MHRQLCEQRGGRKRFRGAVVRSRKVEEQQPAVRADPQPIERQRWQRAVGSRDVELAREVEQPQLGHPPAGLPAGREKRAAVRRLVRIPVLVGRSPARQPVQARHAPDVPPCRAHCRRSRGHCVDPHVAPQDRIECNQQLAVAGDGERRHDDERSKAPPRCGVRRGCVRALAPRVTHAAHVRQRPRDHPRAAHAVVDGRPRVAPPRRQKQGKHERLGDDGAKRAEGRSEPIASTMAEDLRRILALARAMLGSMNTAVRAAI